MSSTFLDNGLYIGLFVRDTEPGTYHWCLYMHHSGPSGKKYHIRDLGSGWTGEFKDTKGALKEVLLIGYLRIASISSESRSQADRLIESTRYDNEGVTCRTWVLEAVQKLVDAGLVRCASVKEIEEDAKKFGATNFTNAGLKSVSPPIVDSVVCGLDNV